MPDHRGTDTVAARAAAGTDPYVRYCRFAAIAFALVAGYTLVVKLPRGGLAHDWLHTVLHVVTGALAVYLGWFRPGIAAQRAFTVGVIVVYGLLGILGWFIDGIALHTALAIPLAAADNMFHLLLALVGLAATVAAARR